MNRFDAQRSVVQTPSGEFVRFSDVSEMKDSLLAFVSNSFDENTGMGLSKEDTLGALNAFFRLTLAE